MRGRKKKGDDAPEDRRAPEAVRIIRADEAQAAIDAGQAAGRRPDDELRFGDVPPQPEGPRPSHRFPLPDTVDPAEAVPRRPVISAKPVREDRRPTRRAPRISPEQAHDPRPWTERVPLEEEPEEQVPAAAGPAGEGEGVHLISGDAELDQQGAVAEGAAWPVQGEGTIGAYDPEAYPEGLADAGGTQSAGYDPQAYGATPGAAHHPTESYGAPSGYDEPGAWTPAPYHDPAAPVSSADPWAPQPPPAWSESAPQSPGYDPASAHPAPDPGAAHPAAGSYGDPAAGAYPYDPATAYPPAAPHDPAAGAYPPDAPHDPQTVAYPPEPWYDPATAAYPQPAAPPDPHTAAYPPEPSYDPAAAPYPSPAPPLDPAAHPAATSEPAAPRDPATPYPPPAGHDLGRAYPTGAYPPVGPESSYPAPPAQAGPEPEAAAWAPEPVAHEDPADHGYPGPAAYQEPTATTGGSTEGPRPASDGPELSPAWQEWDEAPEEPGAPEPGWSWPTEDEVARARPPAEPAHPQPPEDTGDATEQLAAWPTDDDLADRPVPAPTGDPDRLTASSGSSRVAPAPQPGPAPADPDPVGASRAAEVRPERSAPAAGSRATAAAADIHLSPAAEGDDVGTGDRAATEEPGATASETEGAASMAGSDEGDEHEVVDPPSLGLSMSGSTELPHWTDPPSGEVQAIGRSESDDLSAWRALGANATRWRGDGDWDEEVDYDDLDDGEARIGAMDSSRSDHSDLYSFDAEFEALEEERSGTHRALHVDEEPEEEVPAFEPEREPIAVGGSNRPPDSPRTGTRRVSSGTGAAGRTPGPTPLPTGGDRNLGQAVGAGVALGAIIAIAAAIAPWLVMLVTAALVVLTAAEAYGMMQRAGFRPATLLGLVGAAGVTLAAYSKGDGALPIVAAVMFVATMLWYLLQIVEARPLANVAVTTMTWVWVGLLGSYGALLLRAHHGRGLYFGALIPAIAADLVAYGAGRMVGHRRLAPNISPGKTWEGVIAGGIAAIIAGVIIGKEVAPWGGVKHGLLLGLLIAILSPIGDLFESMIKRDLSIKDSGTILPGHGGVLDRFDGILLALPATYYLATYVHIVRL